MLWTFRHLWFLKIKWKKSATNLIIELSWSKNAYTKTPTRFPFALEYHRKIIKGVTKLKIYIRVITRKIMRPAYRHILNTDLINRTFAILFFRRRRHLNEIAEWKMKDSRTKNEETYYDKLDSRRNCCLAGGYLTLYRATVALL